MFHQIYTEAAVLNAIFTDDVQSLSRPKSLENILVSHRILGVVVQKSGSYVFERVRVEFVISPDYRQQVEK
jgi:hypothetical protein